MNKVRRGDFPSDFPVTNAGSPLRTGRGLATPMNNKGPGPSDGNESEARTETMPDPLHTTEDENGQ